MSNLNALTKDESREVESTYEKNNTITTVEIAEMMDISHRDVLNKLQGTTDKDGKVKQIGIIPVLSQENFRLADYFQLSSYNDAQGKPRKCYNVTKMGCNFLANKFNGEKGIIFTAKYVKRFDDMERRENEFQIPKDYPTALRAYADELERNQLLETEKNNLQLELDTSKDWYSIKRVAAMNGVSHKTFNWRLLKDKSIELGYGVKKIFDANYGTINVYHIAVWENVYPDYEL